MIGIRRVCTMVAMGCSRRIVHLLVYLSLAFSACTSGTFTGPEKMNEPPEIWLTSGPVEGDTLFYKIHFYWSGWDPDGEVAWYELVIADGDPFGFDPDDTTGVDSWSRTERHDSVIAFSADSNPSPYKDSEFFTRYDKTHTLFIRSVDLEGKRSEVVTRSFTAWTLAPFVEITHPAGNNRYYSTIITFRWEGYDPVVDPGAETYPPDSIRFLSLEISSSTGIADLNSDPERFEDSWSPWMGYRAPGDSGISTVIGDDEILEYGPQYLFAVQAKDEANAVTAVFREGDNARTYRVSSIVGPNLTVADKYIGVFKFLGMEMSPMIMELPPGVDLNFHWYADASAYGGEISSYRYGWDIQQMDDSAQWSVEPSPYHISAPSKTWHSGIHTFFVETCDNGSKTTLARIQVEIIPFQMDRNLLCVDDWKALDNPTSTLMLPDEQSHDRYWSELCSRAEGFEPARDTYDCSEHNNIPPDMGVIGRYRNVIWIYGNSISGSLAQVVMYVPEYMIDLYTKIPVNHLKIFLARGGHLWTEGRADHVAGGLSVMFYNDPDVLSPSFPASFKYDMAPPSVPDDTSGADCMGYRDYCISFVDKVIGAFKISPDIPPRMLERDALRCIFIDGEEATDPASAGLPRLIELSEHVTQPGMFFDPMIRGFYYVEAYDPEYWLEIKSTSSLPCFHPIYRMRSRSTLSALDNVVVAVWIDKFKDIPAEGLPGGVIPARSIHFGLPLWFFDHAAVDSIADVVFQEWGILDLTGEGRSRVLSR